MSVKFESDASPFPDDGAMPQAEPFIRAHVIAVCVCASHAFSKPVTDRINLLTGPGVEGDAHCGVTVKHRSRVAQDPSQPNLRQVHLIHSELFEELAAKGRHIAPGEMGENITLRGIDLLALPTGTELHIGLSAKVRLTGLRNPCIQLNHFQPGLMSAGARLEGRRSARA